MVAECKNVRRIVERRLTDRAWRTSYHAKYFIIRRTHFNREPAKFRWTPADVSRWRQGSSTDTSARMAKLAREIIGVVVPLVLLREPEHRRV